MRRALCWIRRDLRLSDHRALFEACSNYDEVAVVFVYDENILNALTNQSDRRVTFIMQSLLEVDAGLRDAGSSLIVRHGDPVTEIHELSTQLHVNAVVTARDFEPYALQRDGAVLDSLAKIGVEFVAVKDQVIFEKGEILSKSDEPFRVFTPYSRCWLEKFERQFDAMKFESDLKKLIPSERVMEFSGGLSYDQIGFIECSPWITAGETAGKLALQDFEQKIDAYKESRDTPSANGTSFLSTHLRFGTISIREAVRMAARHDSEGARKWLMELVWREFYQDILANHPRVATTTFNPSYEKLVWPGLLDNFEAWKSGMTGFPIVDAAMRCFAETGWMHNRLRMVVASFLTKDLLVDYRKGEEYFASLLMDFDFASNNGGWQWAASVGCDAQPYFRIFNPYLQSQKFDSEGTFIRRWVPELADLDSNEIHKPSQFEVEMRGYPMPIVDHDHQRKLAIAMFEQVRKSSCQMN